MEEWEIKVDDDALKGVSLLANKQLKLEKEIEEQEARLAEKKKELAFISQVQLPDLFDQLGLEQVTLKDGSKVIVKKAVYCSIPEVKKAFAFDWLTKKGFAAMIKREARLAFANGEEKKMKMVLDYLNKTKALKDISVNINQGIHPQTLKAFARDMVEKGVDLPEEGFSVHYGKEAVIKPPKTKKGF